MNTIVQTAEESDLITAILAGNSQLYKKLIGPHQRAIHALSLYYTRNRDDAEEVAQETLIRAFRNLGTFRSDAKCRTWLISIAINEARGQLRRKATIRIASLDELQDDEPSVYLGILRDQRELPSKTIEREQIWKLIEWAVGMLPNIYRQVYLLREVDELGINETAKILGISTSLVKVRLYRARRLLRKALEPKLKMFNVRKFNRRFD